MVWDIAIGLMLIVSLLVSCNRDKPSETIVSSNISKTKASVSEGVIQGIDSSVTKSTTEAEGHLNQEDTIIKSTKPTEPPSSKQRKKKQKKYGRIVFDSTVYHLKKMSSHEKVNIEFRFRNEGEAPLQILEVDVACGCTTPTIPFLDIMPGEENKISIYYNPVGKSGLQEPKITVITNGIPKKTILGLHGMVSDHEAPRVDSLATDSLPK